MALLIKYLYFTVRGNDMTRLFFFPRPCPVTFRWLPAWAQELTWGIFLHLVELCTYALEGRGESWQALCSSCAGLSDLSVHHPGFMQWCLPCDDSMIVISGHCAFLCNKAHTWSQEDTFATPGSLSTSCVVLYFAVPEFLPKNFICFLYSLYALCALFRYARVLDQVEWDVIPLLVISGVW